VHPHPVNVTPLIDVLLVLIIIFMVIVTETKEKGWTRRFPASSESDSGLAGADNRDSAGRGEEWDVPTSRSTSRA